MSVISSIKTFLLLHLRTAYPINEPAKLYNSPFFHFSKYFTASSFSYTDQNPSDASMRYLRQGLYSMMVTYGWEMTPIL